MIDVGDKPITRRRALARAEVHMNDVALAKIEDGTVAKGDVLATARVAGIAAAKRTPDLLPLCHPLLLDHVRVDLTVDRAAGCVRVEAECRDASAIASPPPHASQEGDHPRLVAAAPGEDFASRPGAARAGSARLPSASEE